MMRGQRDTDEENGAHIKAELEKKRSPFKFGRNHREESEEGGGKIGL